MIGRVTVLAVTPVMILEKKLTVSLSSNVHGGKCDTIAEYVAFELLWHAPFVADEIWGDLREFDGIPLYGQITR